MKEKTPIRIRVPEDIVLAAKKWKGCRQEHFLVITLNGAHDVIKVHMVTKGLVNRTIVHPRECFYHAIKDFAASVIFVHNHPSGRSVPSEEDDSITNRLCLASSILGIHVLDHVIVTSSNNFFSYRQNSPHFFKDEYNFNDGENFVRLLASERNK